MEIGSIEAGGTKFVCGVGNLQGQILDRVEFKTTSPQETLSQVIHYFKDQDIKALGLGCFGPLDLKQGMITKTPKKLWRNYPIVDELKKHFLIPIGFDTDVNAAALGETKFGSGVGLDQVLYLTIGTGIGAGAVVNGKLLHGMMHPEMGHISIKRHSNDSFPGICPYHGDCLEGLASGTALFKRYDVLAEELSDKEEVWELEAYYIAQAIINYLLILSPEKIIIGGGVSKQKQLMVQIRKQVKKLLNNYIQTSELTNLERYIVNPKLKDNAGIIGALSLGIEELDKS